MDKPCEKVDVNRIINLEYPIKIISLGNACYSRTFPERFHLYNFKNNEVRMPFDGSGAPYDSVCELINTEFADFDKNITYERNCLRNTKLNISFVHERTKDISNLKIQLNKRKSQFLNTINSCIKDQSTIVFFCHNDYPKIS